MVVKFRDYENNDYKYLCDFIREHDGVRPTLSERPDGIEGYLQDRFRNDARVIIGIDQKLIISTFMYEFINEYTVQMMYVLINPDRRKNRELFGLINYAINTEKNLSKIDKVRAQTWHSNVRVRELLEKYGFDMVGIKEAHMHPDRKSYIYERDLKLLIPIVKTLSKVFNVIR